MARWQLKAPLIHPTDRESVTLILILTPNLRPYRNPKLTLTTGLTVCIYSLFIKGYDVCNFAACDTQL